MQKQFVASTFAALALVNAAAADNAPETVDETIAELRNAYSKLNGYLASYHSEKPGKSIDITIGMDEASGIGVVQMLATNGTDTMEMRQWCDQKGVFYAQANGELHCLDPETTGRRVFREFANIIEAPVPTLTHAAVPEIELDESGVTLGIVMGPADKPTWAGWLEGASIAVSNDEAVSFLTRNHGEVTIDRRTGLMTEQTLANRDGEVRTIEIREIKPDAGQAAVAKVFKDWPTDGAKPLDQAGARRFRGALFAAMVRAVDDGTISLANMQDFTDEKPEAIARFVDQAYDTFESPFALSPEWERMLDKESFVAKMKDAIPAGQKVDLVTIRKQLDTPEAREKVAAGMVNGMLKQNGAREMAMHDLFGTKDMTSSADTADGKEAARTLTAAVARAYFTTIVTRKIDKLWGPPAAALPH